MSAVWGKLAATWFMGGLGLFCVLALVGLWHAALLVGAVWMIALVIAATGAIIVFIWRE